MDAPQKPSLAFLGPLGTFSHQVAHQYFGDRVSYQPQSSIANVYRALSPEIQYACIPLANSTHGSVIETFDLLRDSRWGNEVSICGETLLKIEHCLVVHKSSSRSTKPSEDRENDTIGSITAVISHEQALGQCTNWLATHLPKAKQIKTSSTSRAAQMISDGTILDDAEGGLVAAICSEICVHTYPNLTILTRNLQDRNDNQTRFIIARHDSATDSPVLTRTIDPSPHRLLLRTNIGEMPVHSLFERLASSRFWKGVRLERMDKRPCLSGSGPLWSNVYFFEFSIRPNDTPFSLKREVHQLQVDLELDESSVALLGTW
ncbi:prephenate dehydratase [Serendipita sp. 407]|nr:prephenate dehydratase [Serendipita sp. 397]KAG8834903.1 prephenate dehydratase [Serendipita sp. 400]KAG9028414.1 prephenate dehydratase [Serendipita sp. 407]